MSQIKSKNTKPEILVRKFLFSKGFRYSLHRSNLPGKPDIILSKYRTVIFINGCFWHGHKNCEYFKIPKTRTKWWTDKINYNIENDKKKHKALKKEGWKVIVIWACKLKGNYLERSLTKLVEAIH